MYTHCVSRLDNLSDEQLVGIIAENGPSGDRGAFDLLLGRYRRIMLIKSAVAPQSGLDADDLMQECAMALMDAVKGYDPCAGASFETYARRCMDNRIVSALRKVNALKRRALRDYAELGEESAADSASDPAEQMRAKETAQEFRRSIRENLSPTEKAVFERYLEGESYAHIAAALDINIRAVDNAIQRVRRKLRKFHAHTTAGDW